jgi:hypothetical protein
VILDTVSAASGAKNAAAERSHLAVAGNAASVRDRPVREKARRSRRGARSAPADRANRADQSLRRAGSPISAKPFAHERGTLAPTPAERTSRGAAGFSPATRPASQLKCC